MFVVVINIVLLYNHFTQPIRTIIVPEVVPQSEEVPKIVSEVNKNNAKIITFFCEKVSIQTWNQGMRFRSQGELYYEPTKRFRFCIRSLMGEEADIGSNDTNFWFWSKRSKEPGLYYAKYEDFNHTRLKTPLNPIWLRGSLGFDPVDVKGAKFSDQGNNFVVVHETRNSIGGKIYSYIFIDKENKRIHGLALSDFKNRLLASCEITYSDNLLSKIFYSWNEENRSMLIEFQNVQINKELESGLWDMPSKKPQIDMGKNRFATLFIPVD
jgi:hypothetical protein